MATAVLSLPRLRSPDRIRARAVPRHKVIENVLLWVFAFAFYIAAASYFVFHLHYMVNDAITRVDNAFDVLYSRDPHLGAIGMFWPPLPSFLDLPILAFKGLWPPLATQAFAGSIEAAAFSAGTVVLFNSGLRWAGVVRGMRWVICLVWMINPMVVIFAGQGMSEAPFMFFFVASILVFLRWCESNRTSLLPLMGVLAGCAALCRVEALFLALLIGVGVVAQSIRNGARWREVETEALLYAMPALLFIGLWLVTAAILFRDPLYVLHQNGMFVHVSQAQSAARAKAYGLVQAPTYNAALMTLVSHVMTIAPGLVGFLGIMAVRLITRPNRVAGIFLVLFGAAIPAIDVYLLKAGTSPLLRYQISVIPFMFLIAVFALRAVRGKRQLVSSWFGLVMAVVLGLSNVVSAAELMQPAAEEERPLLTAIATGQPVKGAGDYGSLASAAQIVHQVLRLDTDHGVILCDSATCFALNMAAPNPKLFLVTSDRNFQAALAQPKVYHVEYFLVPEPTGSGAVDRINQLYPSLWQDGAGFAQLVGRGKGGGSEWDWRLYRITGPTGQG